MFCFLIAISIAIYQKPILKKCNFFYFCVDDNQIYGFRDEKIIYIYIICFTGWIMWSSFSSEGGLSNELISKNHLSHGGCLPN